MSEDAWVESEKALHEFRGWPAVEDEPEPELDEEFVAAIVESLGDIEEGDDDDDTV